MSSSSSSSLPPVVPQHCSNVPLLYELLKGEEERSRVWLRNEMNQIPDPLIDSLFHGLIMSSSSSAVPQSRLTVSELCGQLEGEKVEVRKVLKSEMNRLVNSLFESLTNKLRTNTDLDRSEDARDRTQVGNLLGQVESPNAQSHLVKREIEEENEVTLKKVMDKATQTNEQIEDCVKQEFKEEFDVGELIHIKEEVVDGEEIRVIDIETLTENNQSGGGDSLPGDNARIDSTQQMDCYQPEIKGEFDYEQEIEIKQDEEEDETTNSEVKLELKEELDEEDGGDTLVNEMDQVAENNQNGDDGSQSVDNPPMNTTRAHATGQSQSSHSSQSIRQSKRSGKRKQTDDESQPQVQNDVNINQEDAEVEGTDAVTFRSVRRPLTITLTLRCPQVGCERMFPKDQLTGHLWDSHSIRPFRCVLKDCKESLDNHHLLTQHLKQAHPLTSQWHCNTCPKHYTTYSLLSQHTNQHHQLGQFQCAFPNCTFTGEYIRKVFNHARQHKQPSMKCQHLACHYETRDAADMKKHQRYHSGSKPYKCTWPLCEYVSARKDQTIDHIRRHFGPNTRSVPNGAQLDPKDYLELVHEL